MPISPIGYNNYCNRQNSCLKSKQLSFGSINKDILNIFRNNKTIGKNNYEIPLKDPSDVPLKLGQIQNLDGSIFVRDTTYYARDDLDWFNLGEYLKENFPHIKDADIHCFGCSSGEEAYTIAILLKHLYGQDADFKIKASDICDKQIEDNKKAQKDGIGFSFLTFKIILKGLGVDFDESNKYFYTKKDSEHDYYIKPKIVDSVEFEGKNILTSLDDIDETRPSIIFCRNMWPYINSKYYDEFAKSLYEKLAPGSIVVLGDYDYTGYNCTDRISFPEILEKKFIPLKEVSNYGGHALAFKKSKTPQKHKRNNFYESGQIIRKGTVFNRHTTFYARGDLNWEELGEYLKEKFPHIKDTDIHCFGCSTGEEAYTLALLLKSLYKDEPFKINATDISDDVIANNKINQTKGIKLESLQGRFMLANDLGIKTGIPDDFYNEINSNTYQIKPEIANSIDFSTKNILTSLGDIDKTRPSIVLCRNMWPYIDSKYYDEFAKSLYEKLAPGSIVILGNYDYSNDKKIFGNNSFPKAMRNNNFIPKKVALGTWCDNGDGNEDKVMIFEK